MDVLVPGETCWRIDQAERVAFLIDGQDYFAAVSAVLGKARRSIQLIGWGFDPRTRLMPDGVEVGGEPDEIGKVLIALSRARPELDIHLLIWKSALPIAASQEFFPHRAQAWFRGTRIRFRLDDSVPLGGCHHQKVLVIDDQVAFCSGGDFGIDRWDTTAHLDQDARRIDPNQGHHPPRHDVTVMLQGPAARALGDLCRERWRRSTGETLAPALDVGRAPGDDLWPSQYPPALENIPVALARTEPAWRGRAPVEEWKALTLRSIALARRTLYLENQYFTSPEVAEALARRLAEPDGPEIVLVSTEHSPSYFDKLTMDRTRAISIRRLQRADLFGRFRAFSPHTAAGRAVIVHAKVSIVDDRLLRIGSANLNNRSGGLDTEVEAAIEARDETDSAVILALRNRLVGHYFGRSSDDVAHAVARTGSLIGAIDQLNAHGRLAPIRALTLGPIAGFIAAYHIGDPTGVIDAWKPVKRKRVLDEAVRRIADAPLPGQPPRSKSITSGK
jgi:phosphatidylserine/phosphatidylglycerophosphate/cardiolipin synthase-like enzyme